MGQIHCCQVCGLTSILILLHSYLQVGYKQDTAGQCSNKQKKEKWGKKKLVQRQWRDHVESWNPNEVKLWREKVLEVNWISVPPPAPQDTVGRRHRLRANTSLEEIPLKEKNTVKLLIFTSLSLNSRVEKGRSKLARVWEIGWQPISFCIKFPGEHCFVDEV